MKRCIVEGCGLVVAANGYCQKHLKRWQRHGHVEDTRPKDWGERSKHPLYYRWDEIRRRANVCAEWHDFWLFVEDVGLPPSDRHQLVRMDTMLPYNKENVMWRPPRYDHSMGSAEYLREWRKDDPLYFHESYKRSIKSKPGYSKNWHLLRLYGFDLAKWNELWDAQDNVCPISKRVETITDHGKVRSPHVDHVHEGEDINPKIIRGLTIDNCNRALGLMNNDPEWLARAIIHLAPFTEGGYEHVLDTAIAILQTAKGKEHEHPAVKIFGNLKAQKENRNAKTSIQVESA